MVENTAKKTTAAKKATTTTKKASSTTRTSTAKASTAAKATTTKATKAATSTTAKATQAAANATSMATATAKSAAAKVTAAAPTNAKDAASKAKDATYTAVGLGVMGLTKIQTHARELVKSVNAGDVSSIVDSVKDQVDTAAKATTKSVAKADEAVEAVIVKVEDSFSPYEERLPAQAQELARKARATRRSVHDKFRAKVLENA